MPLYGSNQVKTVRLYTDYFRLKKGYFGLFWKLRKNKNSLVCRRELLWAVRDSNPRPPGCKPRAEDHSSTAYKITDSCLTLVAKNYRGIEIPLTEFIVVLELLDKTYENPLFIAETPISPSTLKAM